MSTDADQSSQVLAFFGNDDGLVQEYAHRWFRQLTEGTDDFSHEVLDGQVSTVDEAERCIHTALSALQTVSLFGGRKVVWLRAVSFLGDNPMGRSQTVLDALDELLNYVSPGLPSDTFFILSAYECDKRRSFYKKFEKLARSFEFVKPDISKEGWEHQVEATTMNAAQERGISFSPDALELFVHRVSESSRQIFNELDKLDVYLGERRQIESEDVEILVPITHQSVIFEIGKALERGNAQRALSLIDMQLENGVQPVGIMRSAILPKIHNLFIANVLVEEFNMPCFNSRVFSDAAEGLPDYARSLIPRKKDGGLNTYGFFKSAEQLKKINKHKLREALEACYEADKILVSSSMDSVVVLHRLVVQLSQLNVKTAR